MSKIKVCGMRDAANIRAVEALGVDMMGFIFWPGSKRYCETKPDYLPAVDRVGVFVNAPVEDVVARFLDYGLAAIQLHGDEDRQYIMQLRSAIGALPEEQYRPYRLIKAIPMRMQEDLAQCEPFVGFVDMFLFDTASAGYGGTGKQFDWHLLDGYRFMTPFLLSGGIGPDSVAALREFKHPCCEGYDLNSRFEQEPGLKEVERLRVFLNQLK